MLPDKHELYSYVSDKNMLVYMAILSGEFLWIDSFSWWQIGDYLEEIFISLRVPASRLMADLH